jgi:coenzyme PQQ synthesis protein D (PqqD)
MDRLPSARRDGLIVESLGEELLVYDGERNRAHSLNGVAAAVWEACDGIHSARGLADAATAKLGVPISEEAVWRALSQLDERGLLAGELPRRMSGREYSRRQAVRRMSVIGASAAFAAPLVKSIVVPTAAEAGASCVPQNGKCGNNTGEGCDTSTFPPCCPATGVNCNPVSDTTRCECNSSTF